MTPRQDIEFDSGGDTLRGWWYGPSGPDAGAVVMAHGLSGVKEQSLDEYAEAFAAIGVGVLVYDHAGFGASDGEPRQEVNPPRQIEGYRDAISHVASLPGVDPTRIGVWGSSMSGGLAISLAATEPRIRCAVAQVPYLEATVDPDDPMTAQITAQMTETLSGSGDGPAPMIPVTAPEGGFALLTADGAQEWAEAHAGRAPAWRNEITLTSLVHVLGFRPVDSLSHARVPLLIIGFTGDTITPPDAAREAADTSSCIEFVEIPGRHFDAYGGPGFAFTSGEAARFFRTHLAAEGGPREDD